MISANIQRLAAREPIEYILGYASFDGLYFRVDSGVLVPYPPSAVFVRVAERLASGSTVHDVGTGCGAIALHPADALPHDLINQRRRAVFTALVA